MPASYGDRIQERCQTFFQDNKLIGLAVSVYDNGEASFLNFGATDDGGASITQHTHFEIASVTKTFTSLLMAQMAFDPDIQLDIHTPADQYLPFTLPEMDGNPIELWHLSTHTSGLPRMPLNYRESFNPYKDYDMAKLEEYYADATLLAVPGKQYGYSNLGVGTLGVALTGVAGVDYESGHGYEALMKERVLEPLDMQETAIFLSEDELAAMAVPHTVMGTDYPAWEFDALAACGALRSTTYDLTQYIAAAIGQTPCNETLSSAFHECLKLQYAGGGTAIGLGFFLQKLSNGQTIHWHDGATGGSRSAILFCPQTGQGVVLLCNSAVPVYELGLELMEILTEAKVQE